MIKRLARRLSTLKQFVGFVLAEVLVERDVVGESLSIEKEKLNLAVIRLSGSGLALTVKLIRPSPSKTKAPKSSELANPRGEPWKIFSASEVEEFIAETDDDNPIHRGELPIVPGFLIVETLLADRRLSEQKKLRLRFKNYAKVGEELHLTVDGARFCVDARERKVEGWILDC